MPSVNGLLAGQHVFEFATDTVVELNTYEFTNYIEHLRSLSSRFTRSGWKAFLDSFSRSDTYNRISEEYINLVSVPSYEHKPNAGRTIIDGQIVWFVKVRVLSREENLSGIDVHSASTYLVRLIEVDRTVSPAGLLVSDIGKMR